MTGDPVFLHRNNQTNLLFTISRPRAAPGAFVNLQAAASRALRNHHHEQPGPAHLRRQGVVNRHRGQPQFSGRGPRRCVAVAGGNVNHPLHLIEFRICTLHAAFQCPQRLQP